MHHHAYFKREQLGTWENCRKGHKNVYMHSKFWYFCHIYAEIIRFGLVQYICLDFSNSWKCQNGNELWTYCVPNTIHREYKDIQNKQATFWRISRFINCYILPGELFQMLARHCQLVYVLLLNWEWIEMGKLTQFWTNNYKYQYLDG